MSDRSQVRLLCGFLALLVVVFAVSYAAGAAVGPGEPGTQRTETDMETETDKHPGGDMDDMEDMHPGGDMGHSSGAQTDR